MKKHFSILLFLAIIGLSLFGFTTMMTGDHANHNCVASMAEGADCSTISSHISALRGFFSAVFTFVMVMFSVIAWKHFFPQAALHLFPVKQKIRFSHEREMVSAQSYRPFLRWRALKGRRDH